MAGTIIKQGVGRSGAAYTATQTGGKGMVSWRIDGIENVTANINAQLMKIKGRSKMGLLAAASEVLKDADTTPPKVPVDKGKLRASQFIKPKKQAATGDPYVELGYGTKYAAAVHEMMQSISGNPINWSRPGSGPKFLQASLTRNRHRILVVVQDFAEIR